MGLKPHADIGAVARSVDAILRAQHLDNAEVVVETGGPRGMIVNIKLGRSQADDIQQLQEILNGYLFETKITHS